ncbi:MAG: phosphoribosylanthranilate isomerase [Planctomycetota bacterium]
MTTPKQPTRQPLMFRVKICGVTSVDDARAAVEAGADAIGVNFYAKSPRCVDRQQATEIAAVKQSVKQAAKLVGVFVNASADEINATIADVPLDAVQLHGDEPANLAAEINREINGELDRWAPLILARPLDQQRGLSSVAEWLDAARGAGRPCSGVLVDAQVRGKYGGTGKVVDWDRLVAERSAIEPTPLLLAGGLTVANVGEAIRRVRPHGVDTASGVEQSPGVKDHRLIQEFVAEARSALRSSG